MKKISAFILIFTFMLSTFAFPLSCKNAEETRVKRMVVLGDSISTGYGLEGYDAAVPNFEIPSYANLAAKELGLNLGENYFNLALDGETSEGLLAGLEGAYSDEKIASIANADVIAVTVGGNDVISILFPKIALLLGLEKNASPLAVTLALATISQNDLEKALKDSEKIYEDNKEEFDAQYEKYAENVEKIIKKLKETAPNAHIFFQTIYNPLIDVAQYTLVETLDAGLVSKVIDKMNETLAETAEKEGAHIVDVAGEFEGRKEACTRADDFDIHPTVLGHSIISDALLYEIDAVYDEIENGNNTDTFSEPKNIWLWFAVSAAVILLAIPSVVFVAKKCKK